MKEEVNAWSLRGGSASTSKRRDSLFDSGDKLRYIVCDKLLLDLSANVGFNTWCNKMKDDDYCDNAAPHIKKVKRSRNNHVLRVRVE
jgi:hypothetical protein